MGVIDATQYEMMRRVFVMMIRETCQPDDGWDRSIESLTLALVRWGLHGAVDPDMQPYVSLFLEEVRSGRVAPFGPTQPEIGFIDTPIEFIQTQVVQHDLFGNQPKERDDAERVLIDQLIAATKLYSSGEAIKELFAFTIRLREFAPFNAMLLHIQKPGLTHAATAQDWHKRFGRVPKKGTRPLLVLRTKGPVDFVFDILDTEGRDVPVDAFAFPTFGNLTDNRFTEFMRSVKKERIDIVALDAGDSQAGWIRLLAASKAKTGKNLYQLGYNRNHDAATRFVTVAHELAHLYLGHLGLDAGRRVPDRRATPHALMEVEAEMAAYLVAMRNGLKPRSESYLANYKGAFEDLNLYAVTRAANAVETAMGIAAQKLWNEKA
jgi:hypothetical protein